MKDWEYSFDPITREAWHRQIEKDLKGKSIHSLEQSWWPGEPLIPLHHREDVPVQRIVLPPALFTSPPSILEWIDIRFLRQDEINGQISSALQYGAQKIILQVSNPEQLEDEDWLEGIYPEMVEWHIQSDDENIMQLPSPLLRKASMASFLRDIRHGDQNHTNESIPKKISAAVHRDTSVRFVYHIPSDGLWDQQTASVLSMILADLMDWTSAGGDAAEFFPRCILALNADRDYLRQVIQTRVLHLLWNNLRSLYVPNEPAGFDYLETHVTPVAGEKPESFLIRASVSSLAAALTGTSALCIHHAADEKVPYFYKRINRNIHHLLHLESGLPKTTDPLSGAWSIDYYTRRWTELIWARLPLK